MNSPFEVVAFHALLDGEALADISERCAKKASCVVEQGFVVVHPGLGNADVVAVQCLYDGVVDMWIGDRSEPWWIGPWPET